MAKAQYLGIFYVIFVTCVISLVAISTQKDEERKVYIVYMGSLPKIQEYSPSAHHAIILQDVVDSRFVEQSLIRSYKRSFNGFAANLTDEESQKLAARDDVVLVFPSITFQLQTTKSWDFMGFPQNVHRNLAFETDIIIGVVDSGIWPESKSFDDHGLGPVPKKWKGVCDGGKNFTCNKKIIGARNYLSGEVSVRDLVGHGTHTASTAAGNNVQNATFYGIAQGTARGGVPSARIAAYRVCSPLGCTADAVMAAFDDAIADGVDIITVSLGYYSPLPLQSDSIAIASLHAAEKGILTVHSAGNNLQIPGSVSSNAPWLFSVAASTTSRKIIAKVVLGDGRTFAGDSINAFKLNGVQFPLVHPKNASNHCAEKCSDGCLDKNLVTGKIVLCNTTISDLAAKEVKRAGGVGVISFAAYFDIAFVTPFPYSPLRLAQFNMVDDYIKFTRKPTATILPSEAIEDFSAPTVALFSSSGPNEIFPDILKPDITAPGVDILAAYSPLVSPSDIPDLDKRSVAYNILSGTSMSCPHVTGAAAYVKSLHPHWSASAIKSALMTTAWKMNANDPRNSNAEFAYGAGHLNPTKAAHPGLVYETLPSDYNKLLCGLNDSRALNISCNGVAPIKAKDLNYPTLAAKVENGKGFRVSFSRTVKNVGTHNSTYRARITKPSHLNITVEPNILPFRRSHESKSFVVTVTGKIVKQFASASLEWFDGRYSVRSPIVVYI